MLFIKVSLERYPEDIFQPARIHYFKNKKTSEYEIVSVAQIKNLLDWKLLV